MEWTIALGENENEFYVYNGIGDNRYKVTMNDFNYLTSASDAKKSIRVEMESSSNDKCTAFIFQKYNRCTKQYEDAIVLIGDFIDSDVVVVTREDLTHLINCNKYTHTPVVYY